VARQNRANNFGDGPAVARLGAKNECLFSAGRFGATHVPQMCPIKVNGERRIPTEWDVVIGNSHDLRGGDVRVDVSPLLGREAEVDDRRGDFPSAPSCHWMFPKVTLVDGNYCGPQVRQLVSCAYKPLRDNHLPRYLQITIGQLRSPRLFAIFSTRFVREEARMCILFRRRQRVIVFAGFVTIAAGLAPTTAWASNGAWSATADLGLVQGPNTATLLQDGRVLVVGRGSLGQFAEMYDPASATWTRQADPIRQRLNHMATLLPDGRVLVVGGDAADGNKTTETFDPAMSSWAPSGDLNVPRTNGQIVALVDGRVLMAGGAALSGFDPLQEAEIYDPATGLWTVTGSMVMGLPSFTMTALQDGTVLAAGGTYDDIKSEVYDPVTGTWSQTGDVMGAKRGFTLTALPDGRALAVGGQQTHHLYDPVSRTWRPIAAPDVFVLATTATLLQDGTVLLAGSDFWDRSESSDVFDPSSESWQLTGNMVQRPRQNHSATLLNDGTVLAVGGAYEGEPCNEGLCTFYFLKSAEVFTPGAGG